MVPDYLLPAQPALSLPPAAPPPPNPNRLALNDSPNGTTGILGQLSPDFRQVQDFANSNPAAQPGAAPLAMTPVAPAEDAEQRRRRLDAEKAAQVAKEHFGKAEPKNLKPVPKPEPRRESGVIAETASELYGKKPGGAPAPVNPQNLTPVVAEIKQERVPGQNLLPEQAWAMGLAPRPDFPDEIDPTAQQPTWGTEEPIRRKYLTPIERGAEQEGTAARQEYERQVRDAKVLGLAQKDALVQQSNAIDEQLTNIAARRKRIAELHDIADRRMMEAESMEPRTRGEIWEQKGNLARGTAILAAVLSGAAAGLQGRGGAPAWDAIERAIDDDVNADRYKAERRMKLGMEARNDFERAVALYGDQDIAALEAKQRKSANILAQTQNMLADRSLDETARIRGEQVYAAGKAAFMQRAQQLQDMLTGKATKEEVTLQPYGKVIQSATPKPTGGGGAAPGITGDKLKGLSAEIRGLAVKMPDGTFKFVRNPVARAETQERLNSARDMIQNLRQLQRLRADKTNTIPWTKKRGQIEAINSSLILLSKSKNQMGALDKGLVEFASKQYGSPEKFNIVDETIDGKIAENIAMLEAETRRMAERELDNGPFELTEGGVSEDITHD
jgi:hypothetical protein